MWSLKMVYHFWMRIFSGRVPLCAATSFLVADRVVLVALDADFFAEAVVADDLDHLFLAGDGARRRLMSVVVFGAAGGSAAVALRSDA